MEISNRNACIINTLIQNYKRQGNKMTKEHTMNNHYNSLSNLTDIVNPNFKNLTVYKVADRTNGFTQIDNRVLRGEIGSLSPEARLALAVFISFPEDWSLYIDYFNKICKFSKGKSRKARMELINKGFLDVETTIVNGKIGYKYTVYELPKNIMFQNPNTEIKQQITNNTIQETESYPINNKENKEIITNKDYQKDSINTCITESNAVCSDISFNKAKAMDTCSMLKHDSMRNSSNTNSNLSKKEQFNIAEISNEESCDATLQFANQRLTELTNRLDIAEKQMQEVEMRKKKRETNAKLLIEYIKKSQTIDDSIRDDLVKFVQMRTEKGIRTTATIFQQLYEDLIAQCSTIAEQKQRIKYAISCGYPTFNKKDGTFYKKTCKLSTQPDFVVSEDDEETCFVEDFEL